MCVCVCVCVVLRRESERGAVGEGGRENTSQRSKSLAYLYILVMC